MVEDDSPDTTDTAPASDSANTTKPPETTSSAPIAVTPERDHQNREILLALIQHGSRPLVMLLIFVIVALAVFFARCHIYLWLANAESVKIGSLEVRIREEAQSGELGKEFRSLANLSDEQLELFLIVGRERKSNINYKGQELSEANLRQLQDLGLLQNLTPAANNQFSWEVTDTGQKVHSTLLRLVADSISRAVRTPVCPKCDAQTHK